MSWANKLKLGVIIDDQVEPNPKYFVGKKAARDG